MSLEDSDGVRTGDHGMPSGEVRESWGSGCPGCTCWVLGMGSCDCRWGAGAVPQPGQVAQL